MVQITLGDKVKDTITGMVGIAVSRTEFLHGCVRISVQPQELKDGKPVDPSYVDEPQLDIIERATVRGYVVSVLEPQRPAGDRPDVQRHPDVRR